MIFLTSALWLITIICFVLLTRRPYIGVLHLILLLQLPAYVIRPLLSNFLDAGIIYKKASEDISYERVHITAYLFLLFLLAGYIFKWFRRPQGKFISNPPSIAISTEWVLMPIIISAVLYAFLFAVGDTRWLAHNRTVGASLLVPEFRYIYPAIVACVFIAMLSSFFKYALKNRMLLFLLVTVICFVFSVLTHQRGNYIFVVLLLLSYWDAYKGFTLRSMLLAALIIFMCLFVMRRIMPYFFTEASPSATSGISIVTFILDNLLFSATGDYLDVWHVVYDYVDVHGYTYGTSLLASPFALLPLSWRAASGVAMSQDILNNFYWGTVYTKLQFGFSVDSSQEIFLAFGWLGVFLMPIMGYLCRTFEEKLFTSTSLTGPSIVEKYVWACAFSWSLNFSRLHWLLMSLFLYVAINLIVKLGRPRSRPQEYGARSSQYRTVSSLKKRTVRHLW